MLNLPDFSNIKIKKTTNQIPQFLIDQATLV